jgi:hypothetical protein
VDRTVWVHGSYTYNFHLDAEDFSARGHSTCWTPRGDSVCWDASDLSERCVWGTDFFVSEWECQLAGALWAGGHGDIADDSRHACQHVEFPVGNVYVFHHAEHERDAD